MCNVMLRAQQDENNRSLIADQYPSICDGPDASHQSFFNHAPPTVHIHKINFSFRNRHRPREANPTGPVRVIPSRESDRPRYKRLHGTPNFEGWETLRRCDGRVHDFDLLAGNARGVWPSHSRLLVSVQ